MIAEALAVPGLSVALSIDVEVTSPTDMFSQMRALHLTARSAKTENGLTVRAVLRFATIGGAHALGLHERTGSITVGKQADLLVLRADGPDFAPVIDPYSTVVLQMDRSHIDTVVIGGTIHRRGGRPIGDDSALVADARAIVDRLTRTGLLGQTAR
jgi:5-methylthioadenosine/S-adenosylhomocysteine deaminase